MSIKEAARFEILNDFGYDDPMTDKGDQHVTMYQVLGGREGIATLVKRFYALMDELPQAKTIRAMHPEDLTESIHKLELFLVGWMGGPSLYMQKYGHPRLRARHLPFAVDSAARDAWMLCMHEALRETGLPEELLEQIEGAFANLANHMRNTPDP